jgi:Predicted integral membrane protein
MKSRSFSFTKYWLPVLLWLGVIFVGSTDLMSAEHTSRIIGPILRWFDPSVSTVAIAQVQFVVRKIAHVSEYAILSVLILRALSQAQWRGRALRAASVTLAMSAVFAATDEFHQSFVPSRTASGRDVMIDIVGVLVGVMIYWALVARKQSRE